VVAGPSKNPAVLVADPGRAQDRLGWSPAHTQIDEIIRTAVAWRRRPAFGERLLSSARAA